MPPAMLLVAWVVVAVGLVEVWPKYLTVDMQHFNAIFIPFILLVFDTI